MNYKILFFTLITAVGLRAQEANKVVLITLDGYRWQELFTGADPALIGNANYVDPSFFFIAILVGCTFLTISVYWSIVAKSIL